ncbi:interferon gamma [Macrotis lagotis]|uniref:interferon gamma n=1 Tax=Macrotis lagotis TaxID=92651 RepID=UPI003D69BDD2
MNYSRFLFVSWLCVFWGNAVYLSQASVRADLKTLMEYFNESTSSNISKDGTLFLSMMGRWKEDSDKKILMSQIVTVYLKIFDIFKNNTVINKSLENITENMLTNFFDNYTVSKLNDFQAIVNTKVNDPRVQKKAIFELALVLDDISSKTYLKKRKRRQNRNQRAVKQ